VSDSDRITPLHEEHVRLGGKMIPFAGFRMPVQYPTGIQAEHRAVREAAGLFDVSHMGEFEVKGPGALDLVQYLTVNDAARLEVGQAQYSALCREDGGVLDDLLVYRLEESYLLVVNAANREADLRWIRAHATPFDASVTDRSDDFALLALQGPRAEEILRPMVDVDLGGVGFYRAVHGAVAGVHAIISRTGYTGEDGFELYLPSGAAAGVWRALLEEGARASLIPVGLGARDSLRLEVGYSLYGNDLDVEHSALESGLGWIVKFGKGEFLGREALARQKTDGVSRSLVGIALEENGFPRSGYPVLVQGEVVGVVTSGDLEPLAGIMGSRSRTCHLIHPRRVRASPSGSGAGRSPERWCDLPSTGGGSRKG
jgi:aminomethyltransferase